MCLLQRHGRVCLHVGHDHLKPLQQMHITFFGAGKRLGIRQRRVFGNLVVVDADVTGTRVRHVPTRARILVCEHVHCHTSYSPKYHFAVQVRVPQLFPDIARARPQLYAPSQRCTFVFLCKLVRTRDNTFRRQTKNNTYLCSIYCILTNTTMSYILLSRVLFY